MSFFQFPPKSFSLKSILMAGPLPAFSTCHSVDGLLVNTSTGMMLVLWACQAFQFETAREMIDTTSEASDVTKA
jgi:hypothetical protein